MRLSLSTAAAPESSLPEILAACTRRGLSGLELVLGHAHGVDATTEDIAPIRRALDASGVVVTAIRADDVASAESPSAARLSAELAAPVVVPGEPGSSSSASATVPRERLAQAVDIYARSGGTLLFEHGTDPAEASALREQVEASDTDVLGLSWQVDPEAPGFAENAAGVLSASGSLLRHIRLLGGGPEAMGQEGLGLGSLMARLALAGYAGNIAIAPSTSRYRLVWRRWMESGGGWGCGSKAQDESLVELDLATVQRGEGR